MRGRVAAIERSWVRWLRLGKGVGSCCGYICLLSSCEGANACVAEQQWKGRRRARCLHTLVKVRVS
jgi:hypothetical protein